MGMYVLSTSTYCLYGDGRRLPLQPTIQLLLYIVRVQQRVGEGGYQDVPWLSGGRDIFSSHPETITWLGGGKATFSSHPAVYPSCFNPPFSMGTLTSW